MSPVIPETFAQLGDLVIAEAAQIDYRKLPAEPELKTSQRRVSSEHTQTKAARYLLRQFGPVQIARVILKHKLDVEWYVGLMAGIANDPANKASERMAAAREIRRLEAVAACTEPRIAKKLAGRGSGLPGGPEGDTPPVDPFLVRFPAVKPNHGYVGGPPREVPCKEEA